MTLARIVFALLIAVTQAASANGDDRQDREVLVVQLREDSFLGSPDGPSAPPHYSKKLESMEGVIGEGIYSSPYQGWQIRIPTVAGNPRVHVHQALIARRPDGTVITSHVLFLPDGGFGAQAVVVTRLRDDRPKSRTEILARFAPGSAAEFARYEKQGVSFKAVDGPLGQALQRTVRNRAFSWHFPYRVMMDTAQEKGSLGVSRYVVTGDFLCEFSIIVDGAAAPSFEALQALAERELDALIGGMLKAPQ